MNTPAMSGASTHPPPSRPTAARKLLRMSSSSSPPQASTQSAALARLDKSIGYPVLEIFSNLILNLRSRPDPSKLRYKHRGIMIEYLTNAGKIFSLRISTVHVAATYLDEIQSRCSMSKKQLLLLTATCLRLACKFEEPVNNIPFAREIIDGTKMSSGGQDENKDAPAAAVWSTPEDFDQMEVKALALLEYRLHFVTAVHLIDYLLTMVPLTPDEGARQKTLSNFVKDFAQLTLCEPELVPIDPLLGACAIVAASRTLLDLDPWTEAHRGIAGIDALRFEPARVALVGRYLARSAIANADDVESPAGIADAGFFR